MTSRYPATPNVPARMPTTRASFALAIAKRLRFNARAASLAPSASVRTSSSTEGSYCAKPPNRSAQSLKTNIACVIDGPAPPIHTYAHSSLATPVGSAKRDAPTRARPSSTTPASTPASRLGTTSTSTPSATITSTPPLPLSFATDRLAASNAQKYSWSATATTARGRPSPSIAPNRVACARIALTHRSTSIARLSKTNLAGVRLVGEQHARPKCTMASASRCAAATSSTQHAPNVVSASTNTSRSTADSPPGSSRSSARRSVVARRAASGSLSSGSWSAIRRRSPRRIHRAVRSTSYARAKSSSLATEVDMKSRDASRGDEWCVRGETHDGRRRGSLPMHA